MIDATKMKRISKNYYFMPQDWKTLNILPLLTLPRTNKKKEIALERTNF